jgi:hypothetical protein
MLMPISRIFVLSLCLSSWKSIPSLEEAASLQRTCLNGQDVLLFILSKLCTNLTQFGVLPIDNNALVEAWSANGNIKDDLLMKSAALVTESILTNGTKGLKMSAAVGCWRCLRHLSAIIVAVISKNG